MDTTLQAKCDLLADNYLVTQKSAKLDWSMAAALGALIYTNKDRQANEEAIRASRKLLKSKVSGFNSMRGNTNIALLVKMATADSPEGYLDNVMDAYNLLKEGQGHHFGSEYEALAASCIVDFAKPEDYETVGRSTHEILRKMMKQHPLLTGREDTAVAALLAMSGLDIDATLAEADACYETLKGDHFKLAKDSLQSIAMILALNDMPVEQKCARFNAMRQAMKDVGDRMPVSTLPILAALVDTDASPEEIAQYVHDAFHYLKKKSGFGSVLGIGIKMRLVMATAVTQQIVGKKSGASAEAAAASEAIATIITQQVIEAIILTIIIVSVCVNASSSNS